ncbi:hypothetical protein RI367_003493 [Sorochytrium milnesiophthora]
MSSNTTDFPLIKLLGNVRAVFPAPLSAPDAVFQPCLTTGQIACSSAQACAVFSQCMAKSCSAATDTRQRAMAALQNVADSTRTSFDQHLAALISAGSEEQTCALQRCAANYNACFATQCLSATDPALLTSGVKLDTGSLASDPILGAAVANYTAFATTSGGVSTLGVCVSAAPLGAPCPGNATVSALPLSIVPTVPHYLPPVRNNQFALTTCAANGTVVATRPMASACTADTDCLMSVCRQGVCALASSRDVASEQLDPVSLASPSHELPGGRLPGYAIGCIVAATVALILVTTLFLRRRFRKEPVCPLRAAVEAAIGPQCSEAAASQRHRCPVRRPSSVLSLPRYHSRCQTRDATLAYAPCPRQSCDGRNLSAPCARHASLPPSYDSTVNSRRSSFQHDA